MSKQSTEASSMKTGGAAEKEVQARAYDAAAAQERMTNLRDKQKALKDAEKAKENELAKIEVSAEDVALIADQLNCSTAVATRRLREKKGDVKAVLKDAIAGKFVKA